jgi:hypothetical protein
MACIFLKGAHYQLCMAYDDLMILSVEELEKFCTTSHYHVCPIYDRFQKDGIKTPIEQHEAYKNYTKS